MVYSHSLADRVRQVLRDNRGIVEMRMFGGVAFLLDGKMLVAVWQRSLIARLGPEQTPRALKQPHVGEFEVTGRPLKGWVIIDPDGLESDQQLAEWIEKASTFVQTLPAK
jgi:hypothetical protein